MFTISSRKITTRVEHVDQSATCSSKVLECHITSSSVPGKTFYRLALRLSVPYFDFQFLFNWLLFPVITPG